MKRVETGQLSFAQHARVTKKTRDFAQFREDRVLLWFGESRVRGAGVAEEVDAGPKRKLEGEGREKAKGRRWMSSESYSASFTFSPPPLPSSPSLFSLEPTFTSHISLIQDMEEPVVEQPVVTTEPAPMEEQVSTSTPPRSTLLLLFHLFLRKIQLHCPSLFLLCSSD